MRRIYLLVIITLICCFSAGTAYAKDTTKPIIKNVYASNEQSGLRDIHANFETSEKSKVTIKVYKGSKLIKTFLDKSIKNEDRLYWFWNWKGKKVDGNYTIKIYAVDLAGNKAITKKINIKVDSIAPKLKSVSITDNPFTVDGKNNKEVKFTLKDEAYVYVHVYDITKKIDVFYYKNFGKKKPGTYKTTWDGNVFGEFTAPTGTYKFKVVARDKALNQHVLYSKNFKLVNSLPPEIYWLRYNEYGFDYEPGSENEVISFWINKRAKVEVDVYQREGDKDKLVKKIFDKEVDEKDRYIDINWDGKDNAGELMLAEKYFYKIDVKDTITGNIITTKTSPYYDTPLIYNNKIELTTNETINVEGSYYLATDSNVSIDISSDDSEFNKHLFDGELKAGTNYFSWDGTDDKGNKVTYTVGDRYFNVIDNEGNIVTYNNNIKIIITLTKNNEVLFDKNIYLSNYINP